MLHFRQIPPRKRGIGTNIEKNLLKGDIKMVPIVALFKNGISQYYAFPEPRPIFCGILAMDFLGIQAQKAQFHTHYSFKMGS